MTLTDRQRRTAKGAMIRAILATGGKTKLAAVCGIRRQSVDKWIRRGYVSHLRCKTIEKATGIPAGTLRPDIF
tara:strand:- start:1433 stop:1651 length:219 start_codon:yes stop_codon:yes gene_type:complete